MSDYSEQRAAMIEDQITARGITDKKVLDTLLKIPRHYFVPAMIRRQAYADEALPIDAGQTISQPYIVAYMTEQLCLNKEDVVLEIGTGSGYQTAVLAELVKKVFTIELYPKLQEQAKIILDDLGYKNIRFMIGDGYAGWAAFAPFDKIMITAAPPSVPEDLLQQLADPGICILPVGRMLQNLVRIEKSNNKIRQTNLIGVRFVPMTHGKRS